MLIYDQHIYFYILSQKRNFFIKEIIFKFSIKQEKYPAQKEINSDSKYKTKAVSSSRLIPSAQTS